jgi:hypothetical protein
MQKEASVLADRGSHDEAARLKAESVAMLEAAEQLERKGQRRGEADRPDIDKKVGLLKERLQDLLTREKKLREAKAAEPELAEVREQIGRAERELKEVQSSHAGPLEVPPEFRPHVEKLAEAGRRAQHLRAAAQHLKMAEAHELARQLMEKAEGMEREVQDAKKRLASELHKARGEDHGPDVVRDLRAENERLRAEVNELRRNREKR